MPATDDNFAEKFHAGTSKPDLPQAESVVKAAESELERFSGSPPRSSKATVSRDVEASDEVAEPTEEEIAEQREQRRQEEAERAERMYDLPMGDGNPRFDEPALTTITEFSPTIPDDLRANLRGGEQQQIVESFIASGIGHTQAQSFVKMGAAASRNGPLSDLRIQQRNADGMKVLERRWGDQVPAKLNLAKQMIAAAGTKWPGLKDYLNATGLGSDPKLIQQLVARAERMPRRKR